LYLPTGSILNDDFAKYDARVIKALRESSDATIVTVHYRLGNGFCYPTPVHDVLTAYDYIQSELDKESDKTVTISRRGRKQKTTSQIGVCGQLLGGSLAAMLALTESKMGESRIAAAAINNPIVDWVFPSPDAASRTESPHDEASEPLEDDTPPESRSTLTKALKRAKTTRSKRPLPSWARNATNAELSAATLLRARAQLFRTPAAYFSPFASPTHFFRSPGTDPPPPTELPPASPELNLDPDPELDAAPPPRRRRAHRVFPPSASTLRLPRVLVALSDAAPLADQGDEFVRLLRRSIERDVRRGRSGFAVVSGAYGGPAGAEDAAREAEDRVRVLRGREAVVWGREGEEAWREDVQEVGAWFGSVLG